jgi:hypothetical protein
MTGDPSLSTAASGDYLPAALIALARSAPVSLYMITLDSAHATRCEQVLAVALVPAPAGAP